MTKNRKLAALVMVVFTLMCTIIPPSAVYAASTPSSWAVEAVNEAIAENLLPANLQSGYDQSTTRAEFACLAVILFEKLKGEIAGRVTFVDTQDPYVEKAASIGVVTGVGDNRFNPDSFLTREQAAVMLSRLSEALDKPFANQAATFADNGSISSWALDAVGRVQAAGIMSGVGENRFSPLGAYTREQCIIVITRTYNAMKPPPEPLPTTEILINRISDPRVNTVGGVSFYIYWNNNGSKTIKYIHFFVTPYNRVGDVQESSIGRFSTADCWVAGPADKLSASSDFSKGLDIGSYYINVGGELKPVNTDGTYYVSYSTENIINGQRKMPITADNVHNVFRRTYWENMWYNNQISSLVIDRVEIEYMDGSTSTLTGAALQACYY